eukprot:4270179-Pyramimonas_sp.AAC.1
MDVDDETDHDPDSTTPPSDHADEEGQGGGNAPVPPSRQERMRSTPAITQNRWAVILARHPQGGSRKRGPPTFPVCSWRQSRSRGQNYSSQENR